MAIEDTQTDDAQPIQPVVITDPVISQSMADFLTPGAVVELTPDEAEALGAFEETAFDEAAAWESNCVDHPAASE